MNHIPEVIQIGQGAEIALLATGFLVLTAVVYRRCVNQKWSKRQGFLAIFGGVYTALVFMNTLVLRSPYKGVHLKLLPLWRLTKPGRYDFQHLLKEILTNVILLLPLGFIINAGFPKTKARIVIAIGFIQSLTIEVLQFISQRGSFETDDLIFNIIGIYAGFLLGRLVFHRSEKSNN